MKNRRLKAAELDKANDPFELLPLQWNNDEENNAFQDLKVEASARLKIICLSRTYKDPSLWGHYADKSRGVCLGFDIEIHKEESKDIISKLEYVEHRMDMNFLGLELDNGKIKGTTGQSHRILTYKSRHWRHEKEWRIWVVEDQLELDSETGLYFFSFADDLKLREILIGFRCDENNIRRRFERLINDTGNYPDPKPRIISTRPSPTKFQIEKVT